MTTGPPWPALLLGALALLLWSPPRDVVVRRARVVARSTGRPGNRTEPGTRLHLPGSAGGRRWLVAGAAGMSIGALMGGAAGAGLAIAVAVGAERVLQAADAEGRAARTALIRDLPGACDLLVVCLGAGVPVVGALGAVGQATPGLLGSELRAVAALYGMGAEPRRAWAGVSPELAGLGRIMVRAGESGSTVAAALRALAADSRAAARATTEADVRRAGVWVLAPLGLFFLPAFVCLGVLPLILGIAGDVFG